MTIDIVGMDDAARVNALTQLTALVLDNDSRAVIRLALAQAGIGDILDFFRLTESNISELKFLAADAEEVLFEYQAHRRRYRQGA